MEEIFKKYPLLKDQNVPRETLIEFELFISMLQQGNDEINIISKETAKNEFIGGMPGIVISIMIKNQKNSIKVHLYEKSHHKSSFLRKVSRDLKLNTEVMQENIFEAQNLDSGTIMARAFKPLPIILDLVYKNFSSYKNLIVFMGKNGEKVLEETLINWDFDFEKKKSITSEDSFLLNIKNIKKKH